MNRLTNRLYRGAVGLAACGLVLTDESFCSFHTPNALNARFITRHLAEQMVAGGFQHFYLGFESGDSGWQPDGTPPYACLIAIVVL